ncbi:venom allergen 3-like [Rhynchophorus ferrugineus]|uniref:SCP domain-containing protein n=1 Tax=Rhynchophorus ferrugineus TaxID=354439 RepID=A0A834I387_RHYFE|nr:hypothetical protein GWI33_020512 [Rhynchophorus ferrugineus]
MSPDQLRLTLLLFYVINSIEYPFLNLLTKRRIISWYQNQSALIDANNPYCSICCTDVRRLEKGRKCGIHSMCIYKSKPTGPACKGLLIMDFSSDEIDAIVDAHNTLRNRVAIGWETDGNPGPQPPSSNTRMISWDHELAKVALQWATQCLYSHDRCRDLERFPVGQNIAESPYASRSDLSHIENWYSNVEFFDKHSVSKYNANSDDAPAISQYTQLVWADTYLVGCARVSFQKIESKQMVYKEHFICNYGPSGNIPHQPVYRIGEPCSACLEGMGCTDPEYPALCGNELLNETYQQKRKHRKALVKPSVSSENKLYGIYIRLLLLYAQINIII